ncbi:MAG: class I SAM-dependent methyltransferase [Flavobacteriales bacterium]|nr:class I SAM-dependent methyltransferase [Flavobacteriales bacterium]
MISYEVTKLDIKKAIAKTDIKSDNDRKFIERVFQSGVCIYSDRIRQYDFTNSSKVLDAGCGFGQWSIALANENEQVYSCDFSEIRINFLNNLAENLGITNICAQKAGIDSLPYKSNFFDAIFCYGVLFVTPWKESLQELSRVLKTGGKLYVNANGLGWYKHLWYTEHNKANDYDPKMIAAETWLNTYKYQLGLDVAFPAQTIIEPGDLQNELRKLGFKDLSCDGEGLLNFPDNPNPFFQKTYLGDTGCFEVIGSKG